MASCIGAAGQSGDLFGEKPILRRRAPAKRRFAPALTAARVLCRELRHKRARPDKQRIAHLICLNLLSMLKQKTQRAQGSGDG